MFAYLLYFPSHGEILNFLNNFEVKQTKSRDNLEKCRKHKNKRKIIKYLLYVILIIAVTVFYYTQLF